MDNLFKSLEQVKEEQYREMQIENNMTILKKELYYQPEIEDFMIGLEYEMWNYDTEAYQKYTMTFEDFYWPVVINQIRDDKCRIKYLDAEDLESLGWQPYDNYWVRPFGAKLELHYILFPTRLSYVEINDRAYEIKNRSELERLMRWLKV